MLLAVDAGNSRVAVAAYAAPDRRLDHWSVPTPPTPESLVSALRAAAPVAGVAGVAISCVAPHLQPALEEWAASLAAPARFAGRDLPQPLPNRYRPPQAVGADRLVNAAMAAHRYGTPVLVVDFGTCTTFDAVSSAGEFVGGAIAAGLRAVAESVQAVAPHLPPFPLEAPPSPLADTTVACLQAGALHGHAALAEGMARRYCALLGESLRVVATGGFAGVLAPLAGCFDAVDGWLTLDGLAWLWREA